MSGLVWILSPWSQKPEGQVFVNISSNPYHQFSFLLTRKPTLTWQFAWIVISGTGIFTEYSILANALTKTLLLILKAWKHCDSVKMDEFTFKESVKQRSFKWGQGSLTNNLFCPRGIWERESGKGSTHHRNLKMTKSLFSERGWNAFYTLSLTSPHNEMQGSVVLRQVKAVPLFCFYKSKWPNLLCPSLRLALFSISRCSSFFFHTPPLERNNWGHLLHIFFFLGIFTS